MPILRNSRHEKFAQLLARAKFGPSEAYRQCGYTGKNADVNCQDVLANPSVAARIAELKAGNAQECKMTRKEALAWLVDVWTCICQSVFKGLEALEGLRRAPSLLPM
jgi:hypothetical protein